MTVRTHHVPLNDSTRSLDVRNPAGSITVEAVAGVEEISIEVQALNSLAEELIDRLDLVVTRSAVRFSVPERKLMLRAPSFAITVTTPPDVAVTATGASSDAVLRGRLGAVTLTTGSGDLTVEHCTELQARSASGDVRAGQVERTATIGTASGDVRVADAAGAVQVRAASGDVLLGSVGGDASVKSASGDITVERAVSGRLRLQTVSGDATVGVEPGLRIWLDVQTVSGRLHTELDDDAPAGGGGAAQLSITLQSVSGDLRVRRATPSTRSSPG